MRSRPKLKVLQRPKIAIPGEPLFIEAILTSRSETPVDFVELVLQSEESITDRNRHQRRNGFALASRHEPGTLGIGEHRLSSRFNIPRDAPASYVGINVSAVCSLSCHVSIPWWPDRRARFGIPIGHALAAPIVPTPGLYCSVAGGPQGKEPYVELSLESTVLEASGVLTGAVAVSNTKFRKIQKVSVALVAIETLKFTSAFYGRKAWPIRQFPIVLCTGAPADGESLPFRLRPADAVPSMRAQLFDVHWEVRVTVSVAWESDVVLAVPVVIAPPTAQTVSRPERWVSPIGRDRRALVLANVAQRTGMLLDAEQERMSMSEAGVALVVRFEHRGAGGSFCIAELHWESLGLELRVGDRKWTDVLAGDVVTVGEAKQDKRFAVHAREPDQVRAFLDHDVLAALMTFPEARVDDEGAVLAAPGNAQAAPQLETFVRAAIHAARTIAKGVERVPPPASMAGSAAAWRDFAARLRGRLERGRMCIHHATFGTDRVDLETRWAGREILGTSVRITNDPPLARAVDIDAMEDDASLSPLTKELAGAIAKTTTSLSIQESEIEAALPGGLEDPASSEPLLEELVRLSRSLRGATVQGPFR